MRGRGTKNPAKMRGKGTKSPRKNAREGNKPPHKMRGNGGLILEILFGKFINKLHGEAACTKTKPLVCEPLFA